MLFRYSGNKGRLLKFYRTPPANCRRIVEPYVGSGAYSINNDLPAIGFDINLDIVEMWHWLQHVTPENLSHLSDIVEKSKTIEKQDVRDLNLAKGPQTYVRINVCSVVVGQLSSWKIYPQHKLPIKKTIKCLDRIKNIEIFLKDANDYEHQDGDLLFIDPPYTGTSANYMEGGQRGIERNYHPKQTINLIESTNNPIIFTYGTAAPEIFPMYDWNVVETRRVANIRRGGTIERTEYVSYINW